MATRKISTRPGVNTQATQLLNEGGWSASNLIRWQDGLLEKIGGWQQLSASTIADNARGMHAFQDLSGNNYLLIGSKAAIQVYFNGALYSLSIYGTAHNVTVPFLHSEGPISGTQYVVTDTAHGQIAGNTMRFNLPAAVSTVVFYPANYSIISIINANKYTLSVPSLNAGGTVDDGSPPQYTASAGRNDIFVFLANHGKNIGDTWTVDLAISVGGISLFGNYIITASVFGPNNFQILAPTNAVTNDTQYGNGTFAAPQGQISYLTTLPGTTRNWSFDNFGQIGLLCYQNGPLAAWQPPISNLNTVGVINGPQKSTGMFVAMPQAQVITFGSDVNGIQDKLLVRFSDAGNYTTWIASATNQAGSFRLSRGSAIVGGIQAPTVTLLWTDLDLWSMQYVGPPFVYSFNIVQTGCGLIAQRARTTLFGETYWMSQKQFFKFGSSGVAPLPCTVWDYIFNDLDPNNQDLCWAWSNAQFNEIWFFFPSLSGGTGEIDSYVKFNVISQLWDTGRLSRTAGIDQSVFGGPISGDNNKILQKHEVGYDANGVAMSGVYAQSGFIDLGDSGTDVLFIDQIIPDFKWFGSNGYAIVTLYSQSYPGSPTTTSGPYTVNSTTRIISLRTRARLIAYRIDWGASLGFSARLGAVECRAAPMGRRP